MIALEVNVCMTHHITTKEFHEALHCLCDWCAPRTLRFTCRRSLLSGCCTDTDDSPVGSNERRTDCSALLISDSPVADSNASSTTPARKRNRQALRLTPVGRQAAKHRKSFLFG